MFVLTIFKRKIELNIEKNSIEIQILFFSKENNVGTFKRESLKRSGKLLQAFGNH